MEGLPNTLGVVAYLFCNQSIVPALDEEAAVKRDANGKARRITRRALGIAVVASCVINMFVANWGMALYGTDTKAYIFENVT